MPRDYRHSGATRPSPKRKQNNRSCVWWLIVGVAVGVVASNILAPKPSNPTAPAKTAASPAQSESEPERAKHKFVFENILTDGEEPSVKQAPPAQRPQPPAQKSPPVAPKTVQQPPKPPAEPVAVARPGTYVVQAGSFSRAADAERLRAQLALLGISTSVQAATLSNGRVTHRVRTGPYSSKQEAEKVGALLRRHGKDSLTIPIR